MLWLHISPVVTGGAGVTQRVVRSAALATAGGPSSAYGGTSARSSAGAAGAGGQGTSTYAHALLPLFQPLPESQPVLPCLLRRLLQQVCIFPVDARVA